MYDAGRRIWTTKEEEQEKAKSDYINILKSKLWETTFFGGDEFGFVDVALIPFYFWLYALEVEGNFKVEDSCPKIVACREIVWQPSLIRTASMNTS
ncbi:hypothetical protein V2J09_012877 [Rumex salicifolius]